ncbi:MATE family efflux transporter [Oceanispirochaeta sp.]|uniref:MATE family efflux transporter n=1 Tax=Oceanispirochaeta sp. TaxID=2035350 RepID=UPI0026021CBE|nr:MATE family efflux transporter [Oceanispirochaeta sp.]MDA3958910.1 MATE family efflux transporter [Oceanispirochaeta sp.]
MKHDHKRTFESESIGKLLFKMALPATIGMIVNALYNLVDTIFVGHGVGAMGIAGLTIGLPVQALIGALGMTFGTGAASIISRRLGEKRPEDAAKTAVNAFGLAFIFSMIIMAIGEIFIDPLLILFGSSETILPFAREYMRVILMGSVFLSFAMVGNNIARAEGQPKIAMLTMVIGAGLNIILDPIFIFGLNMGIRGAAIATVISQFFSFAFIMRFMMTGKSHLPLKWKYIKPDLTLMREINILGMPTLARQGGMSLLALVMNNVLKHYGGDMGIATYGMINRLFMFTLMPIFGVVQGYQPIAGYSYGAKLVDRLREVNIKAFQTTCTMSFLSFLVLEVLAGFLIRMFTSNDELIRLAVPALRISSMGIGLLGLQVIGSTYFMSVGQAFPAFFLSLSRQFVFLIPLVLILPHFLGLKGIWIALPVADVLSVTLTMTWFTLSWQKTKQRLTMEAAAL